MPSFLATLTGKIIAALVLIAIVLGTLSYCSSQRARQQAAQGKVDRSQAGAARESAKDAIATQGEVGRNDRATADLTRRNREEIRNAEGSQERVSDAANAAGRHSLCRRAVNRNRPECRVQQPHSR